jgi:endonuclease/exonuclease/phosphatase family metal-dependent hydrolase
VAEGSDSKGIDFGTNNRFRDVRVEGTVAGRDVHQQTTTGDGAFDRQQLLDALERLQVEIMQLQDAPAGDREDARDELRKASEAAQEGDHDRMVKKLNGAETILHAIGENLPAALALSQTIAVVAQKALGLG